MRPKVWKFGARTRLRWPLSAPGFGVCPAAPPWIVIGSIAGLPAHRRALTHLEDTDHGLQVNERLILRGTVDRDPDEDHRVPTVVIDGREVSRDEFGRMVAASEDWQFKLEFRDRSEVV